MGKPGGRAFPKSLNQRTMKKLLEENGWTEERGGRHVVKMTKPGHRPVTLPIHKSAVYGPGLCSAILTQAGLKSPASADDDHEAETDEPPLQEKEREG